MPLFGCTITGQFLTLDDKPIAGQSVTVSVDTSPLFCDLNNTGAFEDIYTSTITATADNQGNWSVILPWPSRCNPSTTKFGIKLGTGAQWVGTVPEGQAGPFTVYQLKQSYGWALATGSFSGAIVAVAGPTGPAPVLRGAWSAAASYAVNDIVGYQGSSFGALRANTNSVPQTNNSNADWTLLALAGAGSGSGISNRFAWAPNTAYVAFDVLTYGGRTYECSVPFTSGAIFDATKLNLWADKGADGAPGTAGATGQTGPVGTAGAVGQTGPAGAAGQSYNQRGAWAQNTAYAAYDVVSYNGSSYGAGVAIAGSATFNAAQWNLQASAGATGPTGPAGTQWRGTWASGTSYILNDEVYYSGSTFIAVAPSTNVTPTPGATWNLIALAGAPGAAGGTTAATTTAIGAVQVDATPATGNPVALTQAGIALPVGMIGPAALQAVAGNDPRMTNTRTPVVHKTTHATGGTDALLPSDIGSMALAGTSTMAVNAQINNAVVASPVLGTFAATPATGGSLGTGPYTYAVSFVTANGSETTPVYLAAVALSGSNLHYQLSGIPVDPSGIATKRRIYRSFANATAISGTVPVHLLTTITNNTDTTLITANNTAGQNVYDNIADTSLQQKGPSSVNDTGATLNIANVSGNLLDRGGHVYNVQHPAYGALGDGVADDTAALQAALYDCGRSGGGIVFLPPGVYLISAPLILLNHVMIQGAGKRATIIRLKAFANCHMVMNHVSSNATGDPNAEYVGIRDLMLDGNRTNQVKTPQDAVSLVANTGAQAITPGQHWYVYTNVSSSGGETGFNFNTTSYASAGITVAAGVASVTVNLPATAANVASRKVYKTLAGAGLNPFYTNLYYVGTVTGASTTLTDTLSDAAVQANPLCQQFGSNGIFLQTYPVGANNATSQSLTDDSFDTNQILDQIYITNILDNGLHDIGRGAQRLTNITCFNVGRGFIPTFDSIYAGCQAGQCDYEGFLVNQSNCLFTNCQAFYCGLNLTQTQQFNAVFGAGFLVSGATIQFANCGAQDNRQSGFSFNGAVRCTLASCLADSNSVGAAGSGVGFDFYGASHIRGDALMCIDRGTLGVCTQYNAVQVRGGSTAIHLSFDHTLHLYGPSMQGPIKQFSTTTGCDFEIGMQQSNDVPTWPTGTSPAPASLTTSTTGGSLPASTLYSVKLTLANNGAEALAGAALTVTTGAGGANTITVTAPATMGAGGNHWRVYAGPSGSETYQGMLTAAGSTCVIGSIASNMPTVPAVQAYTPDVYQLGGNVLLQNITAATKIQRPIHSWTPFLTNGPVSPNVTNGHQGVVLVFMLTKDGTAGTYALTWDTTYKGNMPAAFTATANNRVNTTFFYDGTNMLLNGSMQF